MDHVLRALEARSPAARVARVGVAVDHNSSYARGAADAPAAIRAAIADDASNPFAELGGADTREPVVDVGDVRPAEDDRWHEPVSAAVRAIAGAGLRPLAVGGDHSITVPVVRALAGSHPDLTIVHFDAHPDIYPAYGGNPYSHASPFARICEENLATRLIQIGIRTVEPEQRRQIERFGVEVIDMAALHVRRDLALDGPVYVSVDIDALDPAFAPGVSHREPGGMSTRELIDWLHRIDAPVCGADLVEVNPRRDRDGLTATVAAKLIKELTALLLARS